MLAAGRRSAPSGDDTMPAPNVAASLALAVSLSALALPLPARAQGAPAPRAAVVAPSSASAKLNLDIQAGRRDGMALVVLRDARRGHDRNQRVARLSEDWLYCSPIDHALFVVPEGYVTDFASVPWYGRMFFPQFGQWAEAAVVHDWLYDVGEPEQRLYADRVFKRAIEEQTGGKVASTLMFLAVRFGGARAYKKAGLRVEGEWADHFAERTGETMAAPPLAQPVKAAWRQAGDCRQVEDPVAVQQLLDEYRAEQGRRAPS